MLCDCMRGYLREQGKALVVEEEGESCKNPTTSIQVRTCLPKEVSFEWLHQRILCSEAR